MVRDYLMQHLGHLWEQFGAREEIEKSLWLAVASSDETTPGSALIALSIAGEEQDAAVKELANDLIKDPATPLILRKVAERVVAP